MARLCAALRALMVLLCVGGAVGTAGAAVEPTELPGLAADAEGYATALRAKGPPKADQALRDEVGRQAAQALAAGDFGRAVAAFERAIAAHDDRPATWMALGQAQAALAPQLPAAARSVALSHALQAGWFGYFKAAQGLDRVNDLLWVARLLEEPLKRPNDALAVYRGVVREARIDDIPMPEAERRMLELRQEVGLTLKTVRASSDDESSSQVCLTFSDPIKAGRTIHLEDFVRLEPAVPQVVVTLPEESELCLGGVSAGVTYQVTVRQGLPGTDGQTLHRDETQPIHVPDRDPLVSFRGQAFILARGDTGGLPVVTVNLEAVAIKVFRVNSRNIAARLKAGGLDAVLNDHSLRQFQESEGELIWQGRLEVKGEHNRETITALAIRSLITNPKPGLYVVSAEPSDVPEVKKPWEKATQWLMMSDLGLTTTRGADGIHVCLRSLASAKPVPGVDIALIARNNGELAHATTDPDGHAVFGVGLTRGSGGQAPLMVTASGADGDFAVLDLTLAAFDLSDRGVGGRKPPGPLDAFLYSDRGVYRPGETVHLTALLRDDGTAAVENFPLTLKVLRPSGTEFLATTLKPAAAGGFVLPLALSASAPLGGWQVLAYGDPKGEPIGRLEFQVEEFVPERLAVALGADQPLLEPGRPFTVQVTSRFLYGPPAAGLGGDATVSLDEDPAPFPQFPGYRFGLAQESVTARVNDLSLPVGDAEGKASLAVELPPQPDTTKPLRATIRVAVSEPGGRPTRQALVVPVRTQPTAIGIKGRFDGNRLEEGKGGSFEIIAVDAQGTRIAQPGLRWDLIAEHHDYQWYHSGDSYTYRVIERDQTVRSGTVSITAASPSAEDVGVLPLGRYRLEVTDPVGGVASSYRFTVGWEASPTAIDTPDTVEVTADRATYPAGATAHIHIQPPFAGEMLVTVATDRLFWTRTLSVPKTGAMVDVPVDAAWGPGAYVTASVYRPPPPHSTERRPVRAIGLTWLPLDTAPRTLALTLDAPEVIRPGRTVDVPVSAPGGAGALVTLAAVDEGILQLTRFVSPDPGGYFFGKRALGLDIRDDYGRLIDTVDQAPGLLRQGGDSGGLAGELPKVPITVVSLFEGPVRLDAQGRATFKLAVPPFAGQLRLMAVAFDGARLGAVSRPVIVRDTLVADATLPRFLAPGDDSRVTVSVHNVEAPAGRYRVAVTGQGPVRVVQPDQGTVVDLAAGARQSLVFPLTADTAGLGGVMVAVTGPLDGPAAVAVQQELGLTVRPSRAVESDFVARQVAPGASVTVDATLLAGYVPGTAGVTVSFSSGPPFDVGGLLAALDRYPFGCLEQTVSRALPLLVVNDVALALGAAHRPDETLGSRVDQAIAQVLDKQRFDGAFGLWSARGGAEPWLTAYAMEFLVRARALKHPVPEAPYLAGLNWLRAHAIDGDGAEPTLASRAYALYTLSLAGMLTPGPARYFADAFLDHLPTPLAKGQLGAALARLGDHDRAEAAFSAALSTLTREPWADDYGSTVRDAAALVLLVTEAGMAGRNRLAPLIDRLPMSAAAVAATNTQEQARLVLAAEALMPAAAPLALTRADRPLATADPVRLVPVAEELAAGVTVRNVGQQPVWQAVGTYGVPVAPRPPAHEGLKIKRNFFWRDGSPVNLDLIKQNDVFVVVLEGEANTKLFHQAIVNQPLPAGWEIENKSLGAGGIEGLRWLTKLSEPVAAELRDDRYVAAVNLTAETPRFKLAFVVRAVTPGSYELPGVRLEDMYKPNFFARQGVGRITVQAVGP